MVKVNLIQFNPNLAFKANHYMSHFGALYILGSRLCSVAERTPTALGTVERIKSPLALKEAELVVEVGHLPQKMG